MSTIDSIHAAVAAAAHRRSSRARSSPAPLLPLGRRDGGSNSAAGYELATGGDPVMAIGGFNGNGGTLSLAQFIRDVRARAIHCFVAGGRSGGAGLGGGGTSSAISAWVAAHFTAQTIGGVTLFDLSRG